MTENLGHLLLAHHLAHAMDAGADRAPDGDEHGCSGTFHVCSCHHSAAFDILPLPAGMRAQAQRRPADTVADREPNPTVPGRDRPSRA